MKLKLIILILTFLITAYPQELKTAMLGDFLLNSGEVIKDCKVTYRTIGMLNEDKSNAILYPTWFGGKSENIIQVSKSLLDTVNYCIIAVDALGNGRSSSPSNSSQQKDSLFPVINIKDIVNSQYEMLTKTLGISHLAAVIGGSMGGMQVFQWVVSYPEFMDKAIAYVGTPRLTSFDLMIWSSEIQAIEIWERNGGSKDDMASLVATIHNLLITTPEEKNQKINRDMFPEYISKLKTDFQKSFNPYDWKLQLNAMALHDISVNGSLDEAASVIKTDFFIIVGSKDLIVNPLPATEFARKHNFRYHSFDNNCGHLAPGCEYETFSRMVKEFINDKPLN